MCIAYCLLPHHLRVINRKAAAAGFLLLFSKLYCCVCLTMAQVRQNFHQECEDGINKQINLELYASYTYLSMVNIHNYIQYYVLSLCGNNTVCYVTLFILIKTK